MKRIVILLISLFVISGHCYADDTSKIEVRGSIDDGSFTVQDTGLIVKTFTGGARQQQKINLAASSFTTITVPTNAKAVLIDVMSADGMKLKGLTGDQGISLDSSCPVLLPISRDGTTTIGIQNMEANVNVLKVYWF